MDLGLSALPGMIYSRSISTSLRLSDVDGGEAAGLPHALLLVFLRGNAPKTGGLSLGPPDEAGIPRSIIDSLSIIGA